MPTRTCLGDRALITNKDSAKMGDTVIKALFLEEGAVKRTQAELAKTPKGKDLPERVIKEKMTGPKQQEKFTEIIEELEKSL